MTIPANAKIYHIVNVDRLASIIETGALLSDSEISKAPLPGTTIGMGSIKNRRLSLPIQCYSNATVGEFVPFYFCPRSIMLYVIYRGNNSELAYKGGQGPIVHLECDLQKVVTWANGEGRSWAFSDANAAAAYAQFFTDVQDFAKLNWNHIGATQWQDPSVKEPKQSEFLVYNKFPWSLIDRIGVQNLATFNAATNALTSATHKPAVQIMPAWYY